MQKLIDLATWRDKRFVDPKPSIRSCQFWAANGYIPAVKRGRKWFVDLNKEESMTGNELVDQFLEA